MSTKAPTLQSTKDYSKFELCQFNRNVEKTKNLKLSMQKHGYIPAYPMHCERSSGSRLKIKAGHHRFEVAQELGLPVFYVVSEDAASIHELEKATTTWKQKDYLASFTKCGLTDYAKVSEFHERTGISLGVCISMLSGEAGGSHNKTEDFKNGTFKVSAEGVLHAEKVADVISYCTNCGVKACDVIFVHALSRCMFVKEFSTEIFKRRVEANAAMLKNCRSVAEQTDIFEAVYNRNATTANRVPLAFLANQAMNARSAVKKPMKLGNST